jgi:hypothetical protein
MLIVHMFSGLLIVAVLALIPQPASAQRWAAISPNNEDTSEVVWADTREDATRRALRSCRRISKTCADPAASTDDMDHLFVTVCCTRPRYGCVTSPRATVEEGRRGAMQVLEDHDFSRCSVRSAVRADDGSRVR